MGRVCVREAVEREAEGVTNSEFDPALDGIDRAAGSRGWLLTGVSNDGGRPMGGSIRALLTIRCSSCIKIRTALSWHWSEIS